jgi:hypothetical protein
MIILDQKSCGEKSGLPAMHTNADVCLIRGLRCTILRSGWKFSLVECLSLNLDSSTESLNRIIKTAIVWWIVSLSRVRTHYRETNS